MIMVVMVIGSCSIQQKIDRKYEGKGRELVLQEYGEPQKIIELENGNQLFIYIKETFIRETEIGTGYFTLDKRVSPSFIKEETYRFLIDKQGIVSDAVYEKRTK